MSISRMFKQASELVRLGPKEYYWMKNDAKNELKEILAGDYSESGPPSLDPFGVVIFGAFRTSTMRKNYDLYVGKISPEIDIEIEKATRERCSFETKHLTQEFLSLTKPPVRYEDAFSPLVVDARVEKLLELNKEYCGGVDTKLEKQIKDAADYQKSWFMNSEGGRKVLSGAEATRRAFEQKPASPDLKL